MSHTWLFRASSALTDRFPQTGAQFLDAFVGATAGNERLQVRELARAQATLSRARRLRRLLVVADLNIGDAVMLQSFVAALRDFLPDAEIEYAVSRLAQDLVDGRDTTMLHPVFRGTGVPGARDADAVRRLTDTRGYDVVFNLCPFFSDDAIAPAGTPVVRWTALATMLVRALRQPDAVAHVTAQVHAFVHALFEPLLSPARERTFTGVTVTLSAEAAARATAFVDALQAGGRPVVFMNPDASSRFTRLPHQTQAELLRGLLRLPCVVVLGAGHTQPGIEGRLIGTLPPRQRKEVRVLPASTPLDAYAAVVDAADVFLTADTGPLHVAAARKQARLGTNGFRNRTAVVSVFGATPVRLYGYASNRRGFLPANQDAPSYAHAATSPCRNLTCINKTVKTCRDVRCFQQVDTRAVLADIAHIVTRAQSTVPVSVPSPDHR
ncbi:MAG: glycosyltransferase family 9 protein [Gemmatimonadota bacterium]